VSDKNEWDEIVSFYDDLITHDDWLKWWKLVGDFVRKLIVSRDVSGLHPFTSHEVLCLTKYKTYTKWEDKPMLTITAASNERLGFSLIEPIEDDEIYRERTETITCPPDRALQVYDELTQKLDRLYTD